MHEKIARVFDELNFLRNPSRYSKPSNIRSIKCGFGMMKEDRETVFGHGSDS